MRRLIRLKGTTMDIVKANIDRFKLLLKTETDPERRAMEIRLLAEERAKKPPNPEPSRVLE
jgi:hypothetical protein